MTPTNLVHFGPVEDAVRDQMTACQRAEDTSRAVLCADNHLGYSMPIGGVIAYESLVSPSAVGFDIGCGNMAVRTPLLASEIKIESVMDEIWRTISFGVGRTNDERVESAVLDEIAESAHPLQRGLATLAAKQLGTVGSGNHYVDLFRDDEQRVWIGVHFGSRGFGHKTATWALDQAASTDQSMHAPPVTFPAASELGALYIDGMQRAGRYAAAGREWVIGRVLEILTGGADISQADIVVHNHHNYAWLEHHGGQAYWVHRKGATPAFPQQRGFVGATMGEPAVILKGIDGPVSKLALYSTVHGAGRRMSRTAAAGKSKRMKGWACGNRACQHFGAPFPAGAYSRGPEGSRPACPACAGTLHERRWRERTQAGAIDWRSTLSSLTAKGIALRGGSAEEAPGAYKRLDSVLDYHSGTIEILHRLYPMGVAMAGDDEFDPYKD